MTATKVVPGWEEMGSTVETVPICLISLIIKPSPPSPSRCLVFNLLDDLLGLFVTHQIIVSDFDLLRFVI